MSKIGVDSNYRNIKKSESEKVFSELFQTTTECQYYTYGIAQGLISIYGFMYNFKDKDYKFLPGELLQIIKSSAEGNKDINIYFQRLLKDIESEVE